jgi:hypothetical protein
MPADFSQIGPFLVAALVVFAIYRRLRRSFGRQPMRPRRMTVRIALLLLLGSTLVPVALRSPQFLWAEVVGAALGVALGVWGAERTRFETYGGRLHYIPHTYTGIAVSLLFLGRLAYRLVQVYLSAHAPHVAPASTDPSQVFAPDSMVKSPLTVGIFFVLVGYYLYYYGWLLWKSKRLSPADMEAAATPS